MEAKHSFKGKWIIIIREIPIQDPPPVLSIFFCVPWAMLPLPKGYEDAKQERLNNIKTVLYTQYDYTKSDVASMSETQILKLNKKYNIDSWYEDEPYGKFTEEAKRLLGAVQIRYKGQQIRLFPEEYSELSRERMREYSEITIYHEVTGDFDELYQKPKDPDSVLIYETALLDGCDKYQALNVLNGATAEDMDDFPPPTGWYEIPVEYRNYFGYK
jgi:hypothetical protein